MTARFMVQKYGCEVRPVHLGGHPRHLRVSDAGAPLKLRDDRFMKLLVGARGASRLPDLLAGPMEEHAFLRLTHPVADADGQQVLPALRESQRNAPEANGHQLWHRDGDVHRGLPQLNADAQVPACFQKRLGFHRLRKEVPAEDSGVQERLYCVGVMLVLCGVDACRHGIRQVLLAYEPQGLLGADVTLLEALQRIAKHRGRVAISYAVDGLGARLHALDKLDLVGADYPAAVTLRHQVQRRVVAVGDPIIIRTTDEKHVLHGIRRRVEEHVERDAIVPAPDHLLGPFAAVQARRRLRFKVALDGEDFQHAERAQTSHGPAAARHGEGHVRTFLEAEVTGVVPVHEEHGALRGAHDDLDVGGILVRRGQHADVQRGARDLHVGTPVTTLAGPRRRSVDVEVEPASQ
mmetsp:Transcript_48499/g.135532  ORF Transcript_48499/g.135532 Transcript_48499/m.135532 type:complete len:406 (-) Transcript_48499:420-1637(-)